MKKLLYVLSGVLFTQLLVAQSVIEKSIFIKNSTLGEIYSYTKTNDGGMVVVGKLHPKKNDNKDHCLIVKLNARATIEWQNTLKGSCFHELYTIVQDSQGDYLISGYSYSYQGNQESNQATEYPTIVKLDSLGNIKWQKYLYKTAWEF